MSYEDEIYHSGYLDGYYASMELYHSDEEMSDEERRARRKKRRRNIALGIGGAAVLGAGGYYGYKKMQKAADERYSEMDRALDNDWVKTVRSTMRKSAPKPKKTVKGFRRNPGSYRFDPNKDFGGFLTLQEMHRKARSRNYKHN